jgi:uncharacterized protein YutE (UPF0331/DUF86 family)
VTGQRLGLPAEEEDLIHKLNEGHVLSPGMGARIREMKGFRNVLVREYTRIDDRLVYQALTERLKDFVAFKQEVLAYLKR